MEKIPCSGKRWDLGRKNDGNLKGILRFLPIQVGLKIPKNLWQFQGFGFSSLQEFQSSFPSPFSQKSGEIPTGKNNSVPAQALLGSWKNFQLFFLGFSIPRFSGKSKINWAKTREFNLENGNFVPRARLEFHPKPLAWDLFPGFGNP